MNGDGIDDILIGGQNRSQAFLILGRREQLRLNMFIEDVADAIFSGENLSDHIIKYRLHKNIERQLTWKEGLVIDK